MSEVVRDGSRVWIEGVPAQRQVSCLWHFDGFPSALRSLCAFGGVDQKYLDDIVFAAIIGQPFRFWFSHDWASSLAYTHEEPLGVIAANTLGFDYNWNRGGYGGATAKGIVDGTEKLDSASVNKAWKKVMEEIDNGNPVIVFGGTTKANPNAAPIVVTGYDAEHDLVYFLPHTPGDTPEWDDSDSECKDGLKQQGYRARKRPDETNWIGNGFAPGQGIGEAAVSFFSLGKQARTPSEHDIAVSILRRAVGLGRGRFRDQYRTMRYSGIPALDLLSECLDREGDDYTHKSLIIPWREVGNTDWWYAMEALSSPLVRTTASLFMERCATGGLGDFSEEQYVLLWAAAGFYIAIADHFGALWDVFLSVGPLGDYEERVLTVNEVMGNRELRGKAADIIRHIRRAEDKAISFLERTLVLDLEYAEADKNVRKSKGG